MKNTFAFLFAFALLTSQVLAQRSSVLGKWKTVDDSTGKVKSIVEISERNGKVFGKILQLFDPEEPNPVCKECDPDDPRHMKPVIGLELIQNMVKDGSEYANGTILDPENGKVYKCKLWVEEGKLMVRGYIAFLYRTQTWLPAD